MAKSPALSQSQSVKNNARIKTVLSITAQTMGKKILFHFLIPPPLFNTKVKKKKHKAKLDVLSISTDPIKNTDDRVTV